jgi:hypothetical protein
MAAACRISHTVHGASARPNFVGSPWTRRYRHSEFSFATLTTRPAMLRGRRRTTGLALRARVVLSRSQSAVQGEQRRRRHGGKISVQRRRGGAASAAQTTTGQPGRIGPADVAAAHRVLVPEH